MRQFHLLQAPFILLLLLLLVTLHPILAAPSPRSIPHAQKSVDSALIIPAPQRSQQSENLLQSRYYQHYTHLPLGWNLYYTTFTQVLPSQVLVRYLFNVYQSILVSTINSFSKYPERNIVTINIGYLEMDFRCETRTIPWQFIVGFVKMAQGMLNKGFHGFYGAMLSHAQAGQVVYVTFRLNPALLGAPAVNNPAGVIG